MLGVALAATWPLPIAAQTLAGTPIVNTAAVRADVTGGSERVASNAVTSIVAERLDCTLVAGSDDRVGGDPTGHVAVVLTNTGNGEEAFALAAAGADGTPRAVVVDEAGDGRFDGARDHPVPGGITAPLAAGAALRLLVEGGPAGAALIVSARATTGSGTPGTVFVGRGDGDGDAVVGTSGAAARLTIAAAAADAPPTIEHSQSVAAADGSTTPRRGSLVTYTLVARFVAASAAASLVDPVPADTAYQPASLILDGAAIPDTGHLVDGRVVVSLGAVAAGAVHRLSFTVVIQ